jgi:hypothetical protein
MVIILLCLAALVAIAIAEASADRPQRPRRS